MIQKTKWIIKKAPDLQDVRSLRAQFKVEETIAYLLTQRGIKTREEVLSFFKATLRDLHDPFLMKDMDRAVARINQALQNNENILIYGDYDVDGTTAVSLVYSYLSRYTQNIDYYIPDRYTEGYGVSEKGINYAQEQGFSLLITLDCGIKAIDKVKMANECGIDVIVCDHHTPGENLPDAIVLDPKRNDCAYPYKELSGCGVGFKLMQALTSRNNWQEEVLFQNMDLLAISIGADIVHVTGENRLMARFGLKQMNENKNLRIGLEEMLRLAKKEKPLTLEDVVFTIAPRINAAGRLEDAKQAVKLLLSTNQEEVKEIAQSIHYLNEERRSLDRETTEEALQQIEKDSSYKDKYTTVVYNEKWHKGVIGIVASRLIERHYRPTIVLTSTDHGATWTGSARSVKNINIYEVLERCSVYLEQFGGHVAAAGLSVTKENLPHFIERFDQEVKELCQEEPLRLEYVIEKKIKFEEILKKENGNSVSMTSTLMQQLKHLEPYGPENMKPLFMATNVRAAFPRLLKGEHIKMLLQQPNTEEKIDAIFFNAKEYFDLVSSGSPFEIVFTLDENQFRGRTTLQLMIKDLRPMR